MSPGWRTRLLALAILASGAVLGVVGTLAVQDRMRQARDDPARWADRLESQLVHDLRLRPEQQAALAGPIAAAATAMVEARIGGERQVDAIMHRLAEALAPSLDAAQRQELDRRLAERTRRWGQRLGVSAARTP